MNLVKASVSRFEIGVDKEGEEEELQEGIEFGEGTPWNWRWVYEERGRNVCCGCFTDVENVP
jgi:hypothetical protein